MEKYNGEYFEGKKHGYGVFTSENGARYEGMWINGHQEGQGTLLHANSTLIKSGIWGQGEFNG